MISHLVQYLIADVDVGAGKKYAAGRGTVDNGGIAAAGSDGFNRFIDLVFDGLQQLLLFLLQPQTPLLRLLFHLPIQDRI